MNLIFLIEQLCYIRWKESNFPNTILVLELLEILDFLDPTLPVENARLFLVFQPELLILSANIAFGQRNSRFPALDTPSGNFELFLVPTFWTYIVRCFHQYCCNFATSSEPKNVVKWNHRLTCVLLLSHVVLQGFLPYSHFLTKGYNNWTNGLYGYSWDMMVHSWDTTLVVVRVVDKGTGEEHFLDPQVEVLIQYSIYVDCNMVLLALYLNFCMNREG